MKTYPCTTEPPKPVSEEFPLTWDEVRKAEGVYQPQGVLDARLITVARMGRRDPITLYFSLDDRVLESSSSHWGEEKFRRTTERLCMEVRP